MTRLLLQTCEACGHTVFPARVLCPRCGSRDSFEQVAANGTVEQVTTNRAGSRIALVATDLGPLVIARAPERVASGSRVTLAADGGVAVASIAQ
jgi:hypothetical protein